MCRSKKGVEEIVREDKQLKITMISRCNEASMEDPPLPRDVCFDFGGNDNIELQGGAPTAVATTSWKYRTHGQSTDPDEKHSAMPPMLFVTSADDSNSSTSCDGMNHSCESGNAGLHVKPASDESPYLPSRPVDNRGSCTCEPSRCACKQPPRLGTARRIGCSPRPCSKQPSVDLSAQAAVATPSTRSNGTAVTQETLSF